MLRLIQRFSGTREDSPPDPVSVSPPAATIQGYVEERSTRHITGWLRSTNDPLERVAFEVAVILPDRTHVIAMGVADLANDALRELGIGDGCYGFRVRFDPLLTERERDHLVVRPVGSTVALELAPRYQGYVDERSIHHISGWVLDRCAPEDRVGFEVVLPEGDTERVLAKSQASQYSPTLAQLSIGDAAYGFKIVFSEPLSEPERDRLLVRVTGTRVALELAPGLRTVFEPVSHVAMDIVNNCNLRCPFCVSDYSATSSTRLMSDATFDSALRLLPFTTDGNFWLSCEHEATLHPELTRFIERVPRQWRHKVMYTTNLAKPMPDAYFDMLAASGLHHVNVSLESLDPNIYERMRKGARWRVFSKNWDRLIDALRAGPAPPRLRYNIMAYRSNLAEIPGLVKQLLDDRLAWQVEIRHTFAVEHIPAAFRDQEFLQAPDWTWLAEQLSHHAVGDVLLLPPPAPDPSAGSGADGAGLSGASRVVTQPLNLRLLWDGRLIVYGEWIGPTGLPDHEQFVVTNIHHLRNPRQFLLSL